MEPKPGTDDRRPVERPDAPDRDATAAAPRTLDALRYVGPSTAEVLRASEIDAGMIHDRQVSFVTLVKRGVDPGVAGRIRREYNLPWSDEPTTGARLRRRADHIRGLRDDERTWIAGGGPATRPAAPASADAAPDGSGRATDAEAAWRHRSRPAGRPGRERPPASGPDATGVATRRHLVVPAERAPPVDPAAYTVPELEEAVGRLDDPVALGAVLLAERDGEARTTAVGAIEARLGAVGVDPEAVTVVGADDRHATRSGGGLLDGTTIPKVTQTMQRDVVEPLGERFDASLNRARTTAAEARRAGSRYETRLSDLESADWERLSLALLLGFVAYGAMVVVVSGLQPAVGPPVAALPLVLVTTVVGVVGLAVRLWDAPAGYELALATGLLGLLVTVLIAAGVFGPVAVGAPVLTVAGFGVVAAAVLVTTHRTRDAPWS